MILNINSIREFKKQITDINNKFGALISDFMGINIKFTLSKNKNDQSYELQAKSSFITYTKPLNDKITEDILFRAAYIMGKYMEENDTITARLYNDFIDEVSMSLIFDEYFELGEEIKFKQLRFVEELKKISFKTYECNKTNMGIVFIPDNIKEKDVMANFPFEFISINTGKTIVELIESEKPMLKVIDNKSVALVVNNNFYVTGIIKKKKESKSIQQVFEDKFANNDNLYLKLSIYENLIRLVKISNGEAVKNEIMNSINKNNIADMDNNVMLKVLNYLNSNSDQFTKMVQDKINIIREEINKNIYQMKYISIRDMEISYYGNENFLLTYSKSKWKIKQYSVLFAYIFEYIIPPKDFGMFHTPIYDDKESLIKVIDELLNKISRLVKILKSLSLNNNGALFVILHNDELDKQNDEYLIQAIPESLIRSSSAQAKDYKSVIRNNDGSIANILEIDNYLLESIASVDGATILDDELNILSFGEIINIRSSTANKKQNIYGARTTAAISASKYGLAIKVSEDGDIEIYKEKKLKIKI